MSKRTQTNFWLDAVSLIVMISLVASVIAVATGSNLFRIGGHSLSRMVATLLDRHTLC